MMPRSAFVLLAVIIAFILGVVGYALPIGEILDWLRSWTQNLGQWGVIAFVLLYIIGALLLIPVLPLTITAGLVYGFWGFPLVVVSANLAASTGFVTARYFMHRRVSRFAKDNLLFTAIKHAVNSENWKIVVLVRLSPALSFSMQNYLLGITDISFFHYITGSLIGMTPAIALYVYIGSLGQVADSGAWKWPLLVVGAIATAWVFWLVVHRTRNIIRQLEIDSQEQNTNSQTIKRN